MVTLNELKRTAALCKLSLEGEDMDALLRDMSGIIEFADAVASADIAAPERGEHEISVLRPDTVSPSLPQDDILKNAHERTGPFFTARGKGLTGK